EAGMLALLEHRERGLPLGLLLRFAHLHDHRNRPDVAEGILQFSVPLAPELVLEGHRGRRARGDRLIPELVDVLRVRVQVERRHARRAALVRFLVDDFLLFAAFFDLRAMGNPPPWYPSCSDKASVRTSIGSQSCNHIPMRISSTYTPRMSTWRRLVPSFSKPRDSYRRRALSFVPKTASSAFLKPRAL